jgi:hypothetical protein
LVYFCPNCGTKAESTDSFCEKCGENLVSPNMISHFSSDEILAGVIVNHVKQHGKISFEHVMKFTRSEERTDRLFAQLERTGNFQIIQAGEKYQLTSLNQKAENLPYENQSQNLAVDKGKIQQLKALLEFGPIQEDFLPEMLDITPEKVKKLVQILLSEETYHIESKLGQTMIYKKLDV